MFGGPVKLVKSGSSPSTLAYALPSATGSTMSVPASAAAGLRRGISTCSAMMRRCGCAAARRPLVTIRWTPDPGMELQSAPMSSAVRGLAEWSKQGGVVSGKGGGRNQGNRWRRAQSFPRSS